MKTRRRPAAAVAVAALALSLAACSSTGGKQQDTSSSDSGAKVADTPKLTIAMVTHETPGDTFWDKIRAGAEAAAKKDNITLKYSNDPDPSKQATLIQQATDSKVDGVATTLATPDALKSSVQAAGKAGIPVVAFNSGIDQWADVGALQYFGSDEDLAGQTAGKRIAANGMKKPLCVIQAAGSVALEARCAGVKKEAPGTTNLQVNGNDDNAVVSTLTAKLQQDKSIDTIVTLGAPIAVDALQAVKSTGSKAHVVTFDLNAEIAKDIQSGSVDFSIDQQPYLQGYLAITQLYLFKKNGNDMGGGQATLTGPSFVDRSNIKTILPFVQKNTR